MEFDKIDITEGEYRRDLLAQLVSSVVDDDASNLHCSQFSLQSYEEYRRLVVMIEMTKICLDKWEKACGREFDRWELPSFSGYLVGSESDDSGT
jgi:hypothetical protein